MTPEELDVLLRAWGRVFGEQRLRDDDGCDRPQLGYGTNPLATAAQFAPGKRATLVRLRVDRGGLARRRLMATGAGGDEVGLRVLPAVYVDHVRGRETRSYRNEARDWPVPPEVQWVQSEWKRLREFDTLRGDILRDEYQRRSMTQGDKAAALGVGLRVYREGLAHARGWMLARLARPAG